MTEATKQNSKRTWLSLLRNFKRYPSKSDTPTETILIPEDDFERRKKEMDEFLKHYFSVLDMDVPDDKLTTSIVSRISVTTDLFNIRGRHDGCIGSKDYDISKIAIVSAQQVGQHILSRVNGTLHGLTESLKARVARMKIVSDDYSQQKRNCDEYIEYSQRDHKNFSLVMCIVYLVFFLALLIADLPVSLNLVGNMDIGSTPSDASFWEKMQDPELLLFSLGICFSTILIKSLYDEYINTRLGSRLIKFQNLEKSYGINKRALTIEYYSKLAIRLIALFGLLVMLYYMGRFRTAYVDLSEEAIKADPSIRHVTLMSFISVTLIVPVIGGICLSHCLAILSNRRTLRNIKEEKARLQKEVEALDNEIVQIMTRKGELEIYQKEWEQESKIHQTAEMFGASYEQSYKASFLKHCGKHLFNIASQFQKNQAYDLLSK